jgi:hypothetical protein
MAGCLDGIRVLELARFQAGPRAGMMIVGFVASNFQTRISDIGREGEFPAKSVTGRWQKSQYNQGRLAKSVAIYRTRPVAVVEKSNLTTHKLSSSSNYARPNAISAAQPTPTAFRVY